MKNYINMMYIKVNIFVLRSANSESLCTSFQAVDLNAPFFSQANIQKSTINWKGRHLLAGICNCSRGDVSATNRPYKNRAENT